MTDRIISAIHDPLTGLYNQLCFDDHVERLRESRQYPITMIVIRLSGLQTVQKRHGQSSADDLMRRLAILLRRTFRVEDIVSRLDNNEFTILLPNTERPDADVAINRLETNVAAYNRDHASSLPVMITYGVATCHKGNDTLEYVLEMARGRLAEQQAVEQIQRAA